MSKSARGSKKKGRSFRTKSSSAQLIERGGDAKRRAPANRIGARGEAAFAHLAAQEGLIPTKLQEDVGLDFICQVDEDPHSLQSSTIASGVVGVSVRSTTSTDGRIALDRSDATDLLRADFPVCVILIKEEGGSDTPWFMPLDAEFRDRLLTFLASQKASLSVTPKTFRPWSEFRSWVTAALVPGSTEQEKIRAAERRLGQSITDVTLEIRRDAHGSLTVVTAMDLYAYFSTLDDDDRYRLYEATFGAADRASSRIAALALKQELVSELNHLPSPFVLQGFTYVDRSMLRVDGPAGSAECMFVKTSNGEHTGWSRGNGFSLTASKSKQAGSVWVHELAAFVDPEEDLDLAADEDLLSFLTCCLPNARIVADASKSPFFAEQFGDLPFYGWFSGYFARASNLRGWSSNILALRDALDEETLHTMAWLAALSDIATGVARMGFSLEADSDPDLPATFRLPVLANTARASVIAWLDCSGLVLLNEDGQGIRGISIEEVRSVELEFRDRFNKRTTDPEFLFDPRMIMARGRHGFYQASDGADYENCPTLTFLSIEGF